MLGFFICAEMVFGALPVLTVRDTNDVMFAKVLADTISRYLPDSGFTVIKVKEDYIAIEYETGLKLGLVPSLEGPDKLNRVMLIYSFKVKPKYKTDKKKDDLVEWVTGLNQKYSFYKFILDDEMDLAVVSYITFENELPLSLIYKGLDQITISVALSIAISGGAAYLE